MTPTSIDWETLCAIYDHGDDENDFDGDAQDESQQQQQQQKQQKQQQQHNHDNNDDRAVTLKVSSFPTGFCGTVYMTLSTSKIAFARLVRSDGSYRYFTIDKPPVLQLDLHYFTRKSDEERMPIDDNEDDDKYDNDYDNDYDYDYGSDPEIEAPSNLRLTWKYYPTEWPVSDKEPYRSSLAKKCHAILRDEGNGFSVCQFLEHNAISFYYGNHTAAADDDEEEEDTNHAPGTTNASNSWKTYADDDHPDYLLVILPPKMDQLYYPTTGSLLHPQKEALLLEEKAAATKKTTTNPQKAASKIPGSKQSGTGSTKPKPKTTKKRSKPTTAAAVVARIDNTLDFGRHALLQNWKDLYTTKCPICLEESVLYSDGVVLPYCQHYCCRNCFDLYLRIKVQDLKEHRTNPFLCPLDSCQRELPMTFCKQFLSDADIATAREWYKDLKHPPAWSLDRCPLTRTCGALGSMRRRKSVVSIDAESGTTLLLQHQAQTSASAVSKKSLQDLHYLVYCDSCKKTWCELCLTRVYDDDDVRCRKQPATKARQTQTQTQTQKQKEQEQEKQKQKHTISTHAQLCNPKPILRFCRRYAAASEDIRSTVRARYPWIVSYSQFCEHDGAALQYVLDHGQRCPNCQTGVERSEGCFHMKCPSCATHFCYECGTELFPPYYGTHHCWEEAADGDDDDDDDEWDGAAGNGNHNRNRNRNRNPYTNIYDMDEQLAAALQWMGND
eukprot:jgi/Psemu1/1720/gm1.1720_g